MSGRNRGRKSSRPKGRGKGHAKAPVRAAQEDASREPDPPQFQSPGRDTQVARVQPGAGGGGSKAAAPPPPPPPPPRPPPSSLQPRVADRDAFRLPLDRGLALGGLAAGERAVASTRPSPRRATSFTERLTADTVFVGTVGAVARPKNGPRAGTRRGPSGKKVPEKSCSSARRARQAAASGKPKKGAAGECPPGPAGEERKMVEPHCGAGPLASEGNMDTLEAVQLKLEAMSAQADRAYLRLSRKFGQQRLPFLEHRNELIKKIPGFWGQALQNHPQLASFFNHQDKEVLSYLSNLEVEELGLARLGYKIRFYFGRNPYFQNKVLIKEYGCGPAGQVISLSTQVQWLPGYDLHSMSQGNPEKSCSFFGWFVNHSSIQSDKIVEIINEELWPNPLQYYLLSEGARGEKSKEGGPGPAKQPAQTPVPQVKPPN